LSIAISIAISFGIAVLCYELTYNKGYILYKSKENLNESSKFFKIKFTRIKWTPSYILNNKKSYLNLKNLIQMEKI